MAGTDLLPAALRLWVHLSCSPSVSKTHTLNAAKANLSYPSCWFQSVPSATAQAVIPAGEGEQIPSCYGCNGAAGALAMLCQHKPKRWFHSPFGECLYPYASVSLTSVQVCPPPSQCSCDEQVLQNAWDQSDPRCPVFSRAPCGI